MTTSKLGGGFDEVARRVADVRHRAERGEPVEPEEHLTFESWEAMTSVMTPRRFELLHHLHRHPAASVAALARALGRDYKRVHEDVGALERVGLINRDHGLRADYDEIRAVIAM
jgi:predicted transcriptional regulator